MAFYEVHATIDGADIKSKKALIAAIKANPESVHFARVSPFNTDVPERIGQLRQGITLQPVGPNPYNSRKWYANVKVINGQVKVS